MLYILAFATFAHYFCNLKVNYFLLENTVGDCIQFT